MRLRRLLLTGAWIVCRSRLPGLLAASLPAASGAVCMTACGRLWWVGAGAAAIGIAMLGLLACRPVQRLRLTLGEPVRLETIEPCGTSARLLAEGRIDPNSVVTPWLVALRIVGPGGRADLILTNHAAPTEDLRRLRLRLLGQVPEEH